jgi:hypothetical protein
MSSKAELAQRVLESLAAGHVVPTQDALELRYTAARPDDSLLTLQEIARNILNQELGPAKTGSSR